VGALAARAPSHYQLMWRSASLVRSARGQAWRTNLIVI
jgi:hypothetical protein